SGDADAYGQLYLRHEPAATSLARYLTRSKHEADDVVADAFARVLRAIRGGAGPTEAFRPYLLTAVRRTVWRHSDEVAHTRLAATEDEAEMIDLRLAVEPEDHSDEGLVLRAFQELPERWQLVLWHTEIEGQPPAAVAPLLGLSANATAALAVRAREGLRQAYLQAHLQARPADTCRFSVEHLGSFVREGLGKRDTAKVEAHLDECAECRELQSDLGSLNKALRSVVGPAVLGAGASRYLRDAARAASRTSSPVEAMDQAHRVAHRVRFPQAVGMAGAAAALLVTLGLSSDLGRPPPPAAASEPAAAAPAAAIGSSQVGTALAGTPGGATPGVQSAACNGAGLPLTLPDGAIPTGASLVETGSDGSRPTTVDPDTAAGFAPVASDGATLVGDGAACVSGLLAPLAEAPPNTALAISFLDPLGRLQVLVVPQIVTVVRDAVTDVVGVIAAADQQLQEYVRAVTDYLEHVPGAGLDGSVPPGVTPTVPVEPSIDVPDLPGLPPATGGGGGGGVGGVVDGVVDGVGGTVDDVVGGAGDTLDGLLG
ncbi:MAG TPA: sigma-70 family RNA polymerase sigma factor, partial [Acidimicrobiales bacterium]